MEARTARRGEIIAGLSGVALIIIMFLKWWEIDLGAQFEGGFELNFDTSFNAWQLSDFNDVIWFITAVLAIALGLAAVSQASVNLPVALSAVVVAAYMLSGFCAALVGLLLAGFTAQAYYDMGKPYLVASIAVVVLGGTSITGGRGHYIGILGGALLFTALSSMLASTALPEALRSIIYGLVLLGAVLMLRERQSR